MGARERMVYENEIDNKNNKYINLVWKRDGWGAPQVPRRSQRQRAQRKKILRRVFFCCCFSSVSCAVDDNGDGWLQWRESMIPSSEKRAHAKWKEERGRKKDATASALRIRKLAQARRREREREMEMGKQKNRPRIECAESSAQLCAHRTGETCVFVIKTQTPLTLCTGPINVLL